MARTLCGEEHYPEPLLAVAGYALPDARRAFPQEPLRDEQWTAVLSGAQTHRVIGQLRASVDGGVLPATEIQARQARAAHTSAMVRVLALERELIAVIDLLAASAIETRILKGSAVAHLDYAQPALRTFMDLDILVRPDDFDSAVHVLSDAGFARRLAEPRPGFDRRFDKGTTLLSPLGYEVDLHRTFVLGPWGLLVDLDDLWEGGQELLIGGRSLRALSSVNRMLHACYHAALGDWPLRLGSLRDVAEMLRRPNQHGKVLTRAAAAWGVEAVVAAALVDTRRLLGIATTSELAAWAEGYVPSRREEARLGLHTHANKTFTAQALATLSGLPRLRDKVAYVRALIRPDAQYTAGRHTSALARFRYGLREARRGRGARQ